MPSDRGLFAVGVGGFFGHIDHKSVFHFVVVAVSAACNELVVERIVRVVPLALVCVVDGFGKRNDAGGHIVFVAARRIHFAARPACDSARIVGGFCVDNLEVAVLMSKPSVSVIVVLFLSASGVSLLHATNSADESAIIATSMSDKITIFFLFIPNL